MGIAPMQASAAYRPGLARPSADRRVLLDIRPAADEPAGNRHVRIVAAGEFGFVVSCRGPSIQIGEASGIPDGVTGGRQIIGCSTPGVVRGLLSDNRERETIVDLVVVPNGVADWRIVVVEGPGSIGPFGEP